MNKTNYCAHILAGQGLSYNLPVDVRANNESAYLDLSNAIKFRLPTNGRILGIEGAEALHMLKEWNRIPYPIIALEYAVDHFGYRVVDGPDADYKDNWSDTWTRRVLLVKEVQGQEGQLLLLQLFVAEDNDGWPLGCSAALDTSATGIAIKVLSSTQQFAGENMRIYQKQTEAIYFNSVVVLADFLAALSCKNVSAVDVKPPEKLNKARINRGKQPFFTYKELVLNVYESGSLGRSTGSHASPRVHLRRGHIRRLPTGNVWVNAAIVGDKTKGIVYKDYALRPLY